jgi:hypothetical protein
MCAEADDISDFARPVKHWSHASELAVGTSGVFTETRQTNGHVLPPVRTCNTKGL